MSEREIHLRSATMRVCAVGRTGGVILILGYSVIAAQWPSADRVRGHSQHDLKIGDETLRQVFQIELAAT